MISKDEIKSILSESRSMALSPDFENDKEIAMDSFTMVTLQASLEDRYGIRLDPRFEEMHLLNSVNDIYDYLRQRFPQHVA